MLFRINDRKLQEILEPLPFPTRTSLNLQRSPKTFDIAIARTMTEGLGKDSANPTSTGKRRWCSDTYGCAFVGNAVIERLVWLTANRPFQRRKPHKMTDSENRRHGTLLPGAPLPIRANQTTGNPCSVAGFGRDTANTQPRVNFISTLLALSVMCVHNVA